MHRIIWDMCVWWWWERGGEMILNAEKEGEEER
jgi:hypothetical protein